MDDNNNNKKRKQDKLILQCLWTVKSIIFQYLDHVDQHHFITVHSSFYNREDTIYEWNIEIRKWNEKMDYDEFQRFITFHQNGTNHFISRFSICHEEAPSWIDDDLLINFFGSGKGRLKELWLENIGNDISDKGLYALGKDQLQGWHGFEILNMKYAEKITDQGLEYLKECPIKYLSLPCNKNITDRGLKCLKNKIFINNKNIKKRKTIMNSKMENTKYATLFESPLFEYNDKNINKNMDNLFYFS